MAPRPYWRGYLKLGLVTCPVELHSGISRGARIQFNEINRKTGNRIRQPRVDEVTREPVESYDKIHGWQYQKDQYILVTDDELAAIRIESDKTIEISSFAPRAQIDGRHFDSVYYLTPSGKVGEEAFAVIREAMRGKDVVAIAHVVIARRDHPCTLEAWDNGIVMTTLRYPAEIRDTKEYFSDIPAATIDPEMLQLAETIIKQKTADFDPSKFVDRYEEALVELLKAKQAGIAVPNKPVKAAPPPVSNLMETLRASIAAEKGEPKTKRRTKVKEKV